MRRSIFEYKDYKTYLEDAARKQPSGGRGFRTQIAEVMGCQTSYISRVLSGELHFSPEQADALNTFLAHSETEAAYFFLMVQYARAGTHSLKQFLHRQIQETQEKQLILKERLKAKDTLTLEDQTLYYSAWYYAAIHVIVSSSKYQTPDAISARLQLPLKQVNDALGFLSRIGIIREKRNGTYEKTLKTLHLGSDSPLISKHHTNWRLQALRALERGGPTNLHYSVVANVSPEDAQKLRELSVSFVEHAAEIIRESPDEELISLNIDLFL